MELAPLLGQRFRALEFGGDGVVRLPDGRREGLQVVAATGQPRQVSGTVRLEHVGRTLRADLSVTPRGLLSFVGLAWPFVAGRAQRAVAESMSRWGTSVADTLDQTAPPDVVADGLMQDLGRALLVRVPD